MTEELIRVVLRESIGVLLATLCFFVYRADARRNIIQLQQTASAYIEFGERRAKQEVEISAQLAAIAKVLEGVEHRLNENMVCPVSQVSSEALRRIQSGGPRPAVTRHELVGAIRQVLKDGAEGA